MISEHISAGNLSDVNTSANIFSAVYGPKQLKVARDSLIISQKNLDISVKLYNEFEETHNTEDQRYHKTEKFQEKQLEIMQGILTELVKLNGSNSSTINSPSNLYSQQSNKPKRTNNKMLQPKSYIYATDLVSEASFQEHLKLYHSYIAKLNEINSIYLPDTILSKSNSTYSEYRALKNSETFVLNAIALHEKYFENITMSNTNTHIPDSLYDLFNAHFDAFDGFNVWKSQFIATAKASRGWVIFGYDNITGTYKNISMDSHDSGFVVGFEPLIVIDCYEHARFVDYYTDVNKYIEMFMSCIDWSVVKKRLKSSSY